MAMAKQNGSSAKKKAMSGPDAARAGATKKAAAPAKIKVSQSTINDIKKLGMKEALKLVRMNAKAEQAGLVAEYQEGTKRLYGERRFKEAMAAPKKATAKKPMSGPDAARSANTRKK